MTVTGARLVRQHLAGPRASSPAAAVSDLGAVQAQELPEAFWAVGQRTEGCSMADVLAALDDGRILRTHVLRPTWHFVTREDVRSMLALTAPRVRRLAAAYNGVFGVDDELVRAVRSICEQALADGRHRTRTELRASLSAAGVEVSAGRMGQLMLGAELDGLVASGRMKGRTQTYALLDERAPALATQSDEEALHALTIRYFASHGPATAKDFAWWATLTLAQVRAGLGSAGEALERSVVDDVTYWSAADRPSEPRRRRPRTTASLLAPFDEFLVGYRESRSLAGASVAGTEWTGGVADLGARTLLLDDQVRGTWTAPASEDEVRLRILGLPLSEPEFAAVSTEVERYASFVGAPLTLSVD